MLGEADFGVVADSFGGGEQDEHRAWPHLGAGLSNHLRANALVLVGIAHGQIGKIADVGKIGEGAGDADEEVAFPCGDDEVGVGEHFGDDVGVVYRPSFAQCGGAIKLDDLF